jgi:hypothetical protein
LQSDPPHSLPIRPLHGGSLTRLLCDILDRAFPLKPPSQASALQAAAPGPALAPPGTGPPWTPGLTWPSRRQPLIARAGGLSETGKLPPLGLADRAHAQFGGFARLRTGIGTDHDEIGLSDTLSVTLAP